MRIRAQTRVSYICLLLLCHVPQQFAMLPTHLEAQQDGACSQPHWRQAKHPAGLQADLQADALSRLRYCPALACMMRVESEQTGAALGSQAAHQHPPAAGVPAGWRLTKVVPAHVLAANLDCIAQNSNVRCSGR